MEQKNSVVGAPYAVMDQMASVCGEANKLLAMVCQLLQGLELQQPLSQILCGLLRHMYKNPLAIVMTPTRELSRQVEKEFYDSAPELDTLYMVGILIYLKLRIAILYEADHMLNVGFVEDVETILDYLPKQRQTMMFSTTMPSWIVKLTHKYLKTPLTIDLVGDSDQKLADEIILYSISS
ncbi:DEAD-box ATP-dependent RNA helicase 53-like protein [Tanacetum coccineum]